MTAKDRQRNRFATAIIAGVAGLLLAAPAPGSAAERTAPAQAVNLAYGTSSSEGYECHQGLYIRWADVKGVENYTLTFYDGHYQSDQSLSVSPPYGDNVNPEGLRPSAGIHQVGWTGGVSFGYGEPPPDWSCEPGTDTSRAQNPVVHWTEPGSFIEGTVTGPCEDSEGDCPLAGVKVQAAAKGKRAKGGNDTTDSLGGYAIKVGAGSYEVAAAKSGLRFDPRTKRVKVEAEQVARADFSAVRGCQAILNRAASGTDTRAKGCPLVVTVKEYNDKPVKGAKISAKGPDAPKPTETDKNGVATLELKGGKAYVVTAQGPKDARYLPEGDFETKTVDPRRISVVGGVDKQVPLRLAPKCLGEYATIVGSEDQSQKDVLIGGGGSDVIHTLAPYAAPPQVEDIPTIEADGVNGFGGADKICGTGESRGRRWRRPNRIRSPQRVWASRFRRRRDHGFLGQRCVRHRPGG